VQVGRAGVRFLVRMHRIPFAAAFGLVAAGCTTPATTSTPAPPMTDLELHARTVRRLYEDAVNRADDALLAQLVHEDFEGLDGGRGPAAFARTVAGLRAGFPDLRFHVEDVVAQGDRVVVRWTWRGTHRGPFRGIAASGREVTNSGIVIYQLRDGRVVRAWLEADRLGVLQQLGALPRL
jgi:steroid delta-isomerase-like uncharacterized protein